MKTRIMLAALLGGTLAVSAAESPRGAENPPPGPKTTEQPPVATPASATVAPPAQPAKPEFVYEQRSNAGRPALVSPEQAKATIDKFKETYKKLGAPRILMYVNRDLVDEKSGVRLSARSERTVASRGNFNSEFAADPNAPKDTGAQSTTANVTAANGNVTVVGGGRPTPGKGSASGTSEKQINENRYSVNDRPGATIADRQTVRDVERLFGRPLRLAKVTLVDQGVATQLMADNALHNFTTPTEGEAARKDREAVSKYADIVMEVLISTRLATVPGVSGDKSYSVPDITVTAIRTKDMQHIGQASAYDIYGKDRYAGALFRNFDVRDIAEATALALMEDISATQ